MSRNFTPVWAVSALLGLIAMPAMAVEPAKPKTVAARIEACMQGIERNHTAGRVMTKQQRMLAEMQCRAAAEAELTKSDKNG